MSLWPMPTSTITFGEVAENGPEMQKLGQMSPRGLSYSELLAACIKFEKLGFCANLIDLAGGESGLPPAWLLIVRNGAAAFDMTIPTDAETKEAMIKETAMKEPLDESAATESPDKSAAMESLDEFIEDLLQSFDGAPITVGPKITAEFANKLATEQRSLIPDKQAIIRGKLKNKLARWNLTFADTAQEPDYPLGKGRVVPFDAVPSLRRIRERLPEFFGDIARRLFAEGNYYYSSKCGIGRHGDGERRIVIAIRLGDKMKLIYQWYHRFEPIGRRIDFELQHGDLYAMSEKAVGTDWKKSSILTLRHAAGHESYLGPP